jgi:hypothetical protein
MLVVVVHPPTFPVYQRMPAHGDRIWASEPTAEVVRKRQPSRSRAFAAGARAASDLTTRKRLHAWQTSHGTQIDAAIGPWYGQKPRVALHSLARGRGRGLVDRCRPAAPLNRHRARQCEREGVTHAQAHRWGTYRPSPKAEAPWRGMPHPGATDGHRRKHRKVFTDGRCLRCPCRARGAAGA